MANVTVLLSCFKEFKSDLKRTGCSLTGRQRWPRKTKCGWVREVEIKLPQYWQGSMTDTIYNLPGVISYGAQLFPGGTLGKILQFFYWRLG